MTGNAFASGVIAGELRGLPLQESLLLGAHQAAMATRVVGWRPGRRPRLSA